MVWASPTAGSRVVIMANVDIWLAEREEEVRKAIEEGDPDTLLALKDELESDISYFQSIVDRLEELRDEIEERIRELR